jgi:ribose transport system substrate-binding protein
MHHWTWRKPATVAAVLLGTLAFAACGGDDDDSGGSSAANTTNNSAPATTGGNDAVAAATKIADEASADIPYEGPTSGPAPQEGKSIAAITCAAAASGCVRGANGVKEAGKELGWNVRVLDGQGQASGQNAAIQQAVSQKVDGIVLIAIDAASVNQGMAAAKKAGIPVVSLQADNEVGDGPNQVTAEPTSGSKRAGESLAAWAIKDSGGKAKVATLSTTELAVTRNRKDAFSEQIAKCADCDVVKDETYLLSSAIKDVPLKVSSMLQANPDLQYLFVDVGQYGGLAAQAIQASGKDVKVLSVDCNPDDLENIKKDSPVAACAGHALETAGFAGVAALNNAFAGESTDGFVIPTKLIDKSNLPTTSTWRGDFDPAVEYGKLWGTAS